MLSFFKSKSSEHKSKANNISLIQVTKSEIPNQSTSDSNTIKKSSNSLTKSNEANISNVSVTQPTGSNIKHSLFSFSRKDEKNIKKHLQQQSNQHSLSTENHTRKEDRKKPPTISSVFSLILENTCEESTTPSEHELQIFDPDPAPDEKETFNHITYIEDKSFIEDDEVNEITSRKLDGLAKENNCYTVNEVPEGRLSKLSSSRASSRASSMASDSTRGSSNVFGEQKIEPVDDTKTKAPSNEINITADTTTSSKEASESSSAANTNLTNGSKNVLLDALIRKFNVAMDIDTTSDNNSDNISQARTVPLQKQPVKYLGDDKKKKQSDLQRKINRSNLEKQISLNTKSVSAETVDKVDATSSMDDDPKPVKIVKSTSTQITRTLNKRNSNYQTICVTKLPQHFECKYIGKTKCQGLWGLKHIREPVDFLVNKARRLSSLEDLVDVEALVTEKGIYIVQKANPPKTSSKDETTNNDPNKKMTQKYYKSGLLPISNISYAVQDNVFGKVFSCIVVNEKNGKTVSECYSFLCRQNDTARKMALSITLAFKEYGKLLQFKETRISRTIQMNDSPSEINGDSFA